MHISIKPLSVDLLNDFLFFFDNIVFTENPDWSKCYCYSFHFIGTDDQLIIDYSSLDYDYLEAYPGKGKLSCEKHYKGPLDLYEKHNFKIIKEYADYYVVRKYLR